MNVWSVVFDGLLNHVHSIECQRSERTCYASTLVKNLDRKKTGGRDNRLKSGAKYDGIVHLKSGDQFEIVLVEVAKDFTGPFSTKWLLDSAKLRLAMREMLLRMHAQVPGDDVSEYQTIGIMNGGFKFQVIRCWCSKKGGTMFYKVSEMVEFPTDIGQIEQMWRLLRLMGGLLPVIEQVRDALLNGPKKARETWLKELREARVD